MRKLIQALALGSVLALSFHNVYGEGDEKQEKTDYSQTVYEGDEKQERTD